MSSFVYQTVASTLGTGVTTATVTFVSTQNDIIVTNLGISNLSGFSLTDSVSNTYTLALSTTNQLIYFAVNTHAGTSTLTQTLTNASSFDCAFITTDYNAPTSFITVRFNEIAVATTTKQSALTLNTGTEMLFVGCAFGPAANNNDWAVTSGNVRGTAYNQTGGGITFIYDLDLGSSTGTVITTLTQTGNTGWSDYLFYFIAGATSGGAEGVLYQQNWDGGFIG